MIRSTRTSLAVLIAVVVLFAGVAFSRASAQQPPVQPPLRGERGSARSIERADTRIRRMIANLQRDQRDYGGHRVRAIGYLQQAESELAAALQYDGTHGR